MIQAVLLFLVVIMLLGVGGKWLRMPPSRSRGREIESAARCAICRAYAVGKRPAPCSRGDCPYRTA